ncbi:NAD(P)-dependent oxidoreductase [Bernardetia sp.]|uniref:NAD(P)-dependent oxidoreductase n=1 Tax=Bernardetia sp. TaxID=1937974 RepID=UPI0025BD68CF|nr:NAD(P)-dependent oxidoreductase [Bernardetia sp.]
MKITFIGLGIMGTEMATHLANNQKEHDFELTVYNRSKEATEKLAKQGTKVADSVNEAVSEADIVFSMLANPEAVENVFFGENGGLSAMKKDTIWLDCSTVNPSFSKRAFEEAKKQGVKFIDAPVAGSKPQAQNKELVFFIGAEKGSIKDIEPYLLMMGQKILSLGDVGKGSSFKMIVNIMLAQSMLMFSESILLGESMGLDRDFLLNTLPNLAVTAPFTKFKAPKIKENDYEVQFPLELMHKDLHLATLTAYEQNQPLFLANLTKELFASAKKEGLGRLDFSAIHQFLEKSK